jgi:ATP-binding cassette subfamily B protein
MKIGKKSILKHYLPEIKKYKGWLIIMILGMLVVIATDLILPFFVREIVDLFATNAEENYQAAIRILWKIGITYFFMWIVWRINEYSITRFEVKGMRDIYRRCFKTIQKHAFRFFTDNFTGSLVKKVSRFVYAFENLIDIFYFNFFYQFIYLSSVFIIFLQEKTLLGIIFLLWSILFLAGNYCFAIWKMKYDKATAAADSKISATLADSFGNYSTVKFFAQESLETEKFQSSIEDSYLKRKFSWDLSNHIQAVQAFLMTGLEILIYYFAIQWWKEGDFSVGDFVFIQIYLLGTFHRLWDFGRNIRQFFTKLADAQEMVDIFEKEIEIQDMPNAKKLKISKGEIEFKNVNFAYEEDNSKTFKAFNLKIKAGEKIAIVGHSRGGKSTLVKLLFRLYNIQSGEILIDGQNIAKITQASLRNNISLVPQDPNLFHRNILENIAYGKTHAKKEEIIKVAKLAQANGFIQKLSKEYKTLVGERGVKLSGGEKQRIAIARVILENAKILVLDEATSSLDSISEKEIQTAIENVMQDKTVIIIAHRLSTIKKVDRVIVLDKGRIIESGTHNQLIRKKGKYAKLWSHQIGGFLAE